MARRAADVIDQGWASREYLDAMVGEVRAWGEKPDAFVAFLTYAAVGWTGGGSTCSTNSPNV